VFLIAIKKINLKKRNFLKKYTYTEIVENSEIYVKRILRIRMKNPEREIFIRDSLKYNTRTVPVRVFHIVAIVSVPSMIRDVTHDKPGQAGVRAVRATR